MQLVFHLFHPDFIQLWEILLYLLPEYLLCVGRKKYFCSLLLSPLPLSPYVKSHIFMSDMGCLSPHLRTLVACPHLASIICCCNGDSQPQPDHCDFIAHIRVTSDATLYLRENVPLTSAMLLYYYPSKSSLKLSGFVLLI